MTVEDLTIVSGGRHLAGRRFDAGGPPVPRPGVLFVHGQGSSQHGYESRARRVSDELGSVCLTFDLSGHGRDSASFDRYWIEHHVDDLVAAYDSLVSHSLVDASRVGLCGASYGGYLAAVATARRPTKRLVLRAPSVEKWTTPEFDSLKALESYEGEVLILESEKDEVIPREVLDAYSRACVHATREVIKGATHALTDPVWDDEFVRWIVKWFGSL